LTGHASVENEPVAHESVVSSRLRLAIDIGGTFTDTVVADGSNSIIASTKTLTSHENPADAAIEGAQHVMRQAGASFESVDLLVHGTTLATNALIERRGAKIASLTTKGFRDILEIAYERRYSQYDIDLQKADFLVPSGHALTVTERLSVNGDVLIALDQQELESIAHWINGHNIEALAVCLLHAYANDQHEQAIARYLKTACPQLVVSLSSEVSPEAREFDRLCTTVANAYIQPLMSDYLGKLASRFEQSGLSCPILMMTASGGMTTLKTAARFPIRLVESGPAGGAVLAAMTAEQCELSEVLSFDMGGTTAKLCLIDDCQPQTARQFEIARAERFIKGSGMPVRIPVVDMIEIGAGGGSIANVDRLGRLHIGPQSAGSEPGPAAFSRGGTLPTVTDADLLLGFIRPERFAEKRFSLDANLAKDAVTKEIANPLSIDSIEAVECISQMVDENMANAARMHAVESGKHLGDRTMIAFGGNGPLHACRVARAAGIKKIVIPMSPGVGSAVGFLYAPISYEIIKSRYSLLESLSLAETNQLLEEMANDAMSIVALGAIDQTPESFQLQRSAYMRYHGQGYEIEIPLPSTNLTQDDIGPLKIVFEKHYSNLFSRPVPGMEIEVLNWSVNVSCSSTAGEAARSEASNHSALAAKSETNSQTDNSVNENQLDHCEIQCDVTGKARSARIMDRADVLLDEVIEGPALIVESQTTTMVAADFNATVDQHGTLFLNQRALN